MVPALILGPDLRGKAESENLSVIYQANPKESHLIAVKRIFRKTTSSACQLLRGKLVCWSAKKKQSVAMSSAEAKYTAAAMSSAKAEYAASSKISFMIKFNSLTMISYIKVPIFCDNTSAIAISNNLVLHSRTKHIDIRYHFIRDHILKGDIELHFIPT
ncbi:hypothetical protein Tco_0510599 [Tanacetum coccineum]